jgi:hypothetical protein
MLSRLSPFWWNWRYLQQCGFPVGAPVEWGGLGAPLSLQVGNRELHLKWLSYLNSLTISQIAKGSHLSVGGTEPVDDLFRDRMEKVWTWIDITAKTGPSRRMILVRDHLLAGQGVVTIGTDRGRTTTATFRSLQDKEFTPSEALVGVQSDFWFRHGGRKEKVPSMASTLARFRAKVGPCSVMQGTLKGSIPSLNSKRAWSVADLTPYKDTAVFGLGPYRGAPKETAFWRLVA